MKIIYLLILFMATCVFADYVDFCLNGGVILFGKNSIRCSCFGTGFYGDYCEEPCVYPSNVTECIVV